jgi:hypothetical protein
MVDFCETLHCRTCACFGQQISRNGRDSVSGDHQGDLDRAALEARCCRTEQTVTALYAAWQNLQQKQTALYTYGYLALCILSFQCTQRRYYCKIVPVDAEQSCELTTAGSTSVLLLHGGRSTSSHVSIPWLRVVSKSGPLVLSTTGPS